MRRVAWFPLAVCLAVTPLFVAAGVQVHRGWRPVSDDAAIAILAHDVFSTRSPLVGMPSTIGRDAGGGDAHAHHPGPAAFWALALPERLSGSAPAGLPVGVAIVNAVAIAAAAIVLRRIAGAPAALLLLVVAVVLLWALGREWVVDPWNPLLGVIPTLALGVFAWAVVAGRTRALIGVAIAGSFVAQTHLIYAPLAAVLFALALAAAVVHLVRRARRGLVWRGDAVAAGAGTVGALAVLWSLPLYDQFAHAHGNLGEVAHSYSAPHGRVVGLGWALRFGVQAIGWRPLFARQGATLGALTRSWSGLGIARIVSAFVVVLLCAALLVDALRRRDRVTVAGIVTSVVALATSVLVVARVPLYFDGAPLYRVLQMWPVGALMWSVVVIGLARAIGARRLVPHQMRVAAFVLGGAVLAVAPIAVAFAHSAGPDDARAARAVGLLAAQVAPRLEHHTAYEITVQTNQVFIGGGVAYGLMRELLRRGDDIRVDRGDEYLGRSHAAPARVRRLVVSSGRRAAAPTGATVEQVAALALATPRDVEHMHALDDRLHDYLTTPEHLTAHGRGLLTSTSLHGDLDGAALRRVLDPAADPQRDNDTLLLIADAVVAPNDHTFQRLRAQVADAHTLVDDYVFAVYLVTPDNAARAS